MAINHWDSPKFLREKNWTPAASQIPREPPGFGSYLRREHVPSETCFRQRNLSLSSPGRAFPNACREIRGSSGSLRNGIRIAPCRRGQPLHPTARVSDCRALKEPTDSAERNHSEKALLSSTLLK